MVALEVGRPCFAGASLCIGGIRFGIGTFTMEVHEQVGASFVVSHGAGLDFLCKRAGSGKMPTHRKN
jgi:hypothetical protein